jgi:prepilin-type processing-associated H-X9-DG protein
MNARAWRIRLWHVLYAVTILACGGAIWRFSGLLTAAIIVTFWAVTFLTPRKTRLEAITSFALVGVLVSLLLPQDFSGRYPARRMQCSNNLKQIALALHNYHDKYGSLPPAYIADDEGNPMHSWRVLILPFLEQQQLYDQYDFHEPWDSPHNRTLIPFMPRCYACPSESSKKPDYVTSYVAVVGQETVWPHQNSRKLSDIMDGTSNTLLVLESTDAKYIWTQPRDISLPEAVDRLASHRLTDIRTGHRSSGTMRDSWRGRNVAMADGSVQYVPNHQSPKSALTVLTSGGGEEPVDFEPVKTAAPIDSTKANIPNQILLGLFIALTLLPAPWLLPSIRADAEDDYSVPELRDCKDLSIHPSNRE